MNEKYYAITLGENGIMGMPHDTYHDALQSAAIAKIATDAAGIEDVHICVLSRADVLARVFGHRNQSHEPGDYRKARGALADVADEPAEASIRRLRDGEDG
jgi:hypothetical protein